MQFVSLAGGAPSVPFSETLFRGLAPDGSLYVPESIPRLTPAPPDPWSTLHDAGSDLLAPFLDDAALRPLRDLLEDAWTWPVPLRLLEEDIFLLEEFHGPTLAFKDLGARFMALAMNRYLEREDREVTLLVATSGDTGSAVASGFHGAQRIRVVVLYPAGQVSPLQERQMTTLGGNVQALTVSGTFDDCQALVKRALNDPDLSAARNLSTANSINLGRLLPQIAFYAWAWAQWRVSHHAGVEPRVVVPSGNFGNLAAALYARAMGVPLGNMVAAVNANRSVVDFLDRGAYAPQASRRTHSSAMDVGDPSNLPRILRLFGDSVPALKETLRAVSVDDEATVEEARITHRRTGVILDPHTAVGVRAARELRKTTLDPIFVAATAHPGKFPEFVTRALGLSPELPDALRDLAGREIHAVAMPAEFQALRAFLLAG